MASFPGSLFTPTVVADDPGGTEIIAAHHNSQDDEILAIETELGTDVAGSATDLKTRLAVSLSDAGHLEFADSTVLTITSGAITVTQNWHRIATEGAAASDDLDTINGLANDGTVLFIRPSTANDVVIKHDTGNIVCVTAADISLTATNEYAVGVYDTNLTKWIFGRMASGVELTTTAGAADTYLAVYTSESNVEGTSALTFDASLMTLNVGDESEVDVVIQLAADGATGYFQFEGDRDLFYFNDHIAVPSNKYVYLGDFAESGIYHNGTNLLIKPDVSGTGKVIITTAQANALVIGAGTADKDYNITFDGETNDGVITWMEDEDYFLFGDDVQLPDNEKVLLGTASDMGIYYDGTNANIDTDLVAASDLTIDCGTAKTLVLEVPVYQDCNIGALVLQTGGTLPGIVQILDNDGDATGIYTRGFAIGEQGSAVVEVPHDYKEGTDLTFHVHWGANDAPSGTDYVAWQLTYSISRDNATFPDSITPAKAETAYDTQYEWTRTDVATITGSTGGVDGGNIKIGDQFHFTLTRVAADGDAFGGEALVASIGFHYQTDTLGSRLIGTK